MEDWAYAGSWENDIKNSRFPIKRCEPSTVVPYKSEKTIYDDTSLRALIYIVECSYDKQPPKDELGSDQKIFSEST